MADFYLDVGKINYYDGSNGPHNLILPDSDNIVQGEKITVIENGGSTTTCILTCQGSDTVESYFQAGNFAATRALTSPYLKVTYQLFGTQWYIFNKSFHEPWINEVSRDTLLTIGATWTDLFPADLVVAEYGVQHLILYAEYEWIAPGTGNPNADIGFRYTENDVSIREWNHFDTNKPETFTNAFSLSVWVNDFVPTDALMLEMINRQDGTLQCEFAYMQLVGPYF